MFDRIRRRLIDHRPELEFHQEVLTSFLIPYYIIVVPMYVVGAVRAFGLDDEFRLSWLLITCSAKDRVGRLSYFLAQKVLRCRFFIPVLFGILGIVMLDHHWNLFEHMGEVPSIQY